MSERLPYEEQLPQLLRDFPLPDEDAAWADMKRRLEEDDDDGIIVWWRRGCLGWALLLIAMLALGWWFLRDKDQKKESIPAVVSGTDKPGQPDTLNNSYRKNIINGDTSMLKRSNTSAEQPDTSFHQAKDSLKKPAASGKKIFPGKNIPSYSEEKKHITKKQTSKTNKTNTSKPGVQDPMMTRPPLPKKDSIELTRPLTRTSSNDSTTIQNARTFLAGDTSKKVSIDSVQQIKKEDTTINTVNKKDSSKKKDLFFSAGIAVFQQIPIAGQKAVPYSSQGRGFSWADYIPSVYVRLNKKDKWFIQGEFRYGAPQYNKPITYYENADTGTAPNPIDTARTLQKTYYHQLPLSFNYYVKPQWSIGAGLVWNKFRKSVYEESVRSPNAPPDSFYSKQTFTSSQSQELSKSYFQGLIETQYQWRKFSLGARYTFGLQPFIKFTLPGEAERKERNQSLQVFLRYELFRTPK